MQRGLPRDSHAVITPIPIRLLVQPTDWHDMCQSDTSMMRIDPDHSNIGSEHESRMRSLASLTTTDTRTLPIDHGRPDGDVLIELSRVRLSLSPTAFTTGHF